MSIVREAIRKRYALLPFWYTMFFEHERNGSPVMRPMLSQYPLDKNTFTLDDQYMLSDKLLVRPVIHEGATTVDVYFPAVDGDEKSEIWYDTDDYTKFESVGIQSIEVDELKIPVFQRGGTIIPRKEVIRRASAFMIDDPVSLFVAVDEAEKANGTLFVDNETNFDYRRSKYIYLQLSLADGILTSRLIDENNGYETNCQVDRILFAGFKEVPEIASIETVSGERSLDIVNVTETSFVIENVAVNLGEEWTIVFSASMHNIVCGTLLIGAFLLHFLKHILL